MQKENTSRIVKNNANRIVGWNTDSIVDAMRETCVTMDEDKQELLEIYKLHAELADRVSQRREGANRLYVSTLTGVLILLAASLRYGTEVIPVGVISAVGGIIGALLSGSWFIVIRSYRQLNRGKFDALHELEKELAYPFFKREWEILEEGNNKSRYWKLTVAETFLPAGFFVLSLTLIVASFMIK